LSGQTLSKAGVADTGFLFFAVVSKKRKPGIHGIKFSFMVFSVHLWQKIPNDALQKFSPLHPLPFPYFCAIYHFAKSPC